MDVKRTSWRDRATVVMCLIHVTKLYSKFTSGVHDVPRGDVRRGDVRRDDVRRDDARRGQSGGRHDDVRRDDVHRDDRHGGHDQQ